MSVGANSFGSRFVVTSFGESHGPGLGVIIDGCPAGVNVDLELLLSDLKRRRPGRHGKVASVVSDREEEDQPEILSGVFEGKTLGTPIAVLVRNRDQRSEDYREVKAKARPGHADDMWREKFGHSDHRGGGRSSGRETLARVIAGSFAKMLLRQIKPDINILGFVREVGPLSLSREDLSSLDAGIQQGRWTSADVDAFTARIPSVETSQAVEQLLLEAKAEGKSYGGVAELWVQAPPAYLGQPVFHKLKSELAAAMLSVGATSAFELGSGFAAASAEGSAFHNQSGGDNQLLQDQYGGIRGGIGTGETIRFSVAFKPTATVLDVAKKGRHDPCIVPRAVPVLEAMTALVLADHVLWSRTDRV